MAKLMIEAGKIPQQEADAIHAWFVDYSNWMNTHPYGIKEREHPNNHSIAWSLQIAAFADLTGDQALLNIVRDKFKHSYLTKMMDEHGGFPKELARTKPYGYSIFVLDLMAGIASIASDEEDDLWHYKSENGRSMALGVSFLTPYVKDKSSWPYAKDIQYWQDWPVRQPFLLQAGLAFNHCELIKIASALPATSKVYEVKRNWPLRNPILWLTD